ncbi:MAG: hypothetical protein WCA78_02085 [Rhizomicrobium sp.]
MPKSVGEFLDHFALNLCHTADCFHAGQLAQAFAVTAIAFLHSNEFVLAMWMTAFAVAATRATYRAACEAWVHTIHSLARSRTVDATKRTALEPLTAAKMKLKKCRSTHRRASAEKSKKTKGRKRTRTS